ncbi:MAG: hypothetical protein ABJ004_18240 [Cyclobacteriaceae bacterium]
MKRITNILALVLLSFVLTYCSTNKKPEQTAEEKKEALEAFVEKTFEYPIPTSFEVTKMLEEANAEYQPGITNSTDNSTKYIAEWQKAINLGVYGADLSYSSTFDQTEQTMEYLKVSKQLVEDLNISTAFNMGLVSRIESNVENKDSLILIVTESFYDTYNYLNQNGDEKTSILVVAGSVIEGLYITTKLIESSENKAELMTVLANQKEQVTKLTALLEKHATDENVAKVLPDLRYISLFYEQLGDSNEITEGQFNDVAKSISQMRWDIVG